MHLKFENFIQHKSKFWKTLISRFFAPENIKWKWSTLQHSSHKFIFEIFFFNQNVWKRVKRTIFSHITSEIAHDYQSYVIESYHEARNLSQFLGKKFLFFQLNAYEISYFMINKVLLALNCNGLKLV